MRNIFFFIKRHFNLLFFFILQGFCIYLIVHYNKYHNAVFSNTINQYTGKINEQYSTINNYFRLKQTNDSLWKTNEKLYNKLKSDFQLPDSSSKTVIDSISIDSIKQYKKYTYLSAQVIQNEVNTQSNFIVLNRGNANQLKEGMGIIDYNKNVVGIITELSNNYAVAMSLLHKDSHISGKLLKTGETGTLNWDGKSPNIISIAGIPQSAKVAKGDTIITSGFSTTFPKGMIIGFVTEITPDKSTNNFLIKFKTAANFYNLQYVYAIDNSQQNAINNLLDKAKQKIK